MDSGQYEKLEKAIFNAAVGSESPDRVADQTVTRESIENGIKVKRVQRIVAADANIPLAKMLLDQRIGGPQDYC